MLWKMHKEYNSQHLQFWVVVTIRKEMKQSSNKWKSSWTGAVWFGFFV